MQQMMNNLAIGFAEMFAAVTVLSVLLLRRLDVLLAVVLKTEVEEAEERLSGG